MRQPVEPNQIVLTYMRSQEYHYLFLGCSWSWLHRLYATRLNPILYRSFFSPFRYPGNNLTIIPGSGVRLSIRKQRISVSVNAIILEDANHSLHNVACFYSPQILHKSGSVRATYGHAEVTLQGNGLSNMLSEHNPQMSPIALQHLYE